MEYIILNTMYTSIVTVIFTWVAMTIFDYRELPKLVGDFIAWVFIVGFISIFASAIALIWV